jgi:hypothetical protein
MSPKDTSLFVGDLVGRLHASCAHKLIVVLRIYRRHKDLDILVKKFLLSEEAKHPASGEINVRNETHSVVLTTYVDERRTILKINTASTTHIICHSSCITLELKIGANLRAILGLLKELIASLFVIHHFD